MNPGDEHVAEHVAVGAAVLRGHLRDEPPDDDEGDRDEDGDPEQPEIDEVAGQRPARRRRPAAGRGRPGARRAFSARENSKIPSRAAAEGEDDEQPLHEDQRADEHGADREPDQGREDEVAPGALLDALVGLFELRARVRDLALELAARRTHVGLERRGWDRSRLAACAGPRHPAWSAARPGADRLPVDRRMRRS